MSELTSRNLPQFSLEKVQALVKQLYGIEGDYKALLSERDLSYRIRSADNSYVLKISNGAEPEGVVDYQVKALEHIARLDPELPVPHMIHTLKDEAFVWVEADDGKAHMLRLLNFMQGEVMEDNPAALNNDTRYNVGAMMGRVACALRNFFHPYADSNEHLWDLHKSAQLRPMIARLPDAELQALCTQVLDHFENFTLPRLQNTRWQVVHQDAHSGNVLVNPDKPTEPVGIIDFGDMVYGSILAEVVVAADSFSEACSDPVGNLCATAAGFDTTYPLEAAEVDLLYDMALIRMFHNTVIIGARASDTASGDGYLEDTGKFPRMLKALVAEGRDNAIARIRQALRFPVYSAETPEDEAFPDHFDELFGKREQKLGEMWHFYDTAMHFTRGQGAYLYTPDGCAYLDGYNNVPQIGHSHPHVVKAIARQAAALNTNTRYLCDIVADYAERLTKDLPEQLNACIFVNSGSEANDFAMQIAKSLTGNKGGIVMEDAYHGCTELTGALSPIVYHREDWVETLQNPDNYRGPHAGKPDAAERYAADADRALRDLESRGHRPAAFMIDTAFCSNGVTEAPANYLNLVAEKVRAAGGLVIADEVQAGCGRMGTFWGFRANGLNDENVDMITMGKPVGNAHPLGVVILNRDLLDTFQKSVNNVFSTFGGNTVACAAGMAVLDVIEREKLIDKCNEVGDYLRSELRRLADSQPLIGHVRGRGMMTGLEFVSDRDAKTPATAETARLLELMKDNRVLIGSEGTDKNIIKLRPSLAWSKEDVDFFIQALDKSLNAL